MKGEDYCTKGETCDDELCDVVMFPEGVEMRYALDQVPGGHDAIVASGYGPPWTKPALKDVLERMGETIEALAGFDADALECARTRFHDPPWARGDPRRFRRGALREILQGGLTIDQAARFLGISESDCVGVLLLSMDSPERRQAILDAESLLRQGVTPLEISRQSMLTDKTLIQLRRTLGIKTPFSGKGNRVNPAVVNARVRELYGQGMQALAILNQIKQEMPEETKRLKYGAVYSVIRTIKRKEAA